MNIKEINLTPAELRAILEHKRIMSEKQSQPVTLEQAVEHFIHHLRADWLREKQHRDTQAQQEEIEKHKYLRSKDEGRDIGKAVAAEEWCAKYAHIWRAERESLERNGFIKANVVIQAANGLHIEPASTLAILAGKFDCEVYLHRDNMDYYNLMIQGKRYMNVKSILGLLSVAAKKGDSLELIATGPEAKPALEAIVKLMTARSSEARPARPT